MKRVCALLIALVVVWASVCTGTEEYTQPASSEANPPEVTSPPPTVDNEVGIPQSDGECVVGEAGPETGNETVYAEPVEGEPTVEPKPGEGQEPVDPGIDGGGEVVGSEPGSGSEAGKPKSEDGTGSTEGSSQDSEIVYMKPVFTTVGSDDVSEAGDPGADSGLDNRYVILTAAPGWGVESVAGRLRADFAGTLGLASQSVAWVGTPAQTNVTINLSGMPSTAQMWTDVDLNMAAHMPSFPDVAMNPPSFVGQAGDLTIQGAGTINGTLGAVHLQMPELPAGF